LFVNQRRRFTANDVSSQRKRSHERNEEAEKRQKADKEFAPDSLFQKSL
jgi:hypothetical protein